MHACSERPLDAPAKRSAAGGPRYRYVRRRWRVLFSLIDFVGAMLVRRGVLRRAQNRRAQSPRSILLVQLDHLGDAVLTTGLLAVLRRRYPAARIELLAAPWNRELFAGCPEVNRVFVCRRNRFATRPGWGWLLALVGWAWRLRRRQYDLGIDVRGELPQALLLALAGARRRIGWAAGGGGFLLTDSAEYDPTRHEAASRGAIVDLLPAEPGEPAGTLQPCFVPCRAARERIGQMLAELPSSGPRVVLHVGAGTSAKRWPVEHWQELLGRLVLERGDLRIVLVGGPEDIAGAAEITGGLPWPGVSDWTGRLNITQLAALVERADVFVGADSGPAHLAAAVGSPVVVLFSGTNDARVWQPLGSHVTVLRQPVACAGCRLRHCPLDDHPCMRGLQPERVAQAIQAALSPPAEFALPARRLTHAWQTARLP